MNDANDSHLAVGLTHCSLHRTRVREREHWWQLCVHVKRFYLVSCVKCLLLSYLVEQFDNTLFGQVLIPLKQCVIVSVGQAGIGQV